VDSKGNILVIQSGLGLSGHTVDADGCVASSKILITDTSLTHSVDVYNNKLYASSSEVAWVWDYSPETMATSNKRTLVTGMNNTATRTRTLWVSRMHPDYLIVSVGSTEELDFPSNPPGTDRASVKVFDMRTIPQNGVNYATAGKLMGSGIRNVVALAEDKAGIMHGAENAMDDSYRLVNGIRTDVKDDNPAENVFNLGDPTSPTGFFGGYPYCFVVWEPNNFVDKRFQPGDWFVQEPNSTFNDTTCDTKAKKPTVILTAHTAPLDMKFGVGADSNLYLGMHGRWHSNLHIGYKVVSVAGSYSSTGEWSPKAPLSSRTSFVDVIANVDATTCKPNCFHPVGLAWSANGENLYVTSDSSGEIFLVKKSLF